MLTSGKPQSQIAQYFDVTPGAVSKAKKELSIQVTRTLAMETANRIVGFSFNTLTELQALVKRTNTMLDDLSRQEGKESLVIKTIGEVRQQIALMETIQQNFYDRAGAEQFKAEVLETLGEFNGAARDRLVARMKSQGLIRYDLKIRD